MESDLALLTLTAAAIGVIHTALGPDHYLPFVMLARSERWSQRKTLGVTLLCGVGHVLSSVLLGAVGIALGVAVGRLERIECLRGELAVWGLIAFGLTYGVWGLRRAQRNRPHSHVHAHSDGTVHSHIHVHQQEHVHVHRATARSGDPLPSRRFTPWVLFVLFVFGPCEPLIPLLMYPAPQGGTGGIILVTAAFGVATLATMAVFVMLGLSGVERLPWGTLKHYTHALAGFAVVLCGMAIALFGL